MACCFCCPCVRSTAVSDDYFNLASPLPTFGRFVLRMPTLEAIATGIMASQKSGPVAVTVSEYISKSCTQLYCYSLECSAGSLACSFPMLSHTASNIRDSAWQPDCGNGHDFTCPPTFAGHFVHHKRRFAAGSHGHPCSDQSTWAGACWLQMLPTSW